MLAESWKSFVFAFLMISIASAVHAEEATDKLKKMPLCHT